MIERVNAGEGTPLAQPPFLTVLLLRPSLNAKDVILSAAAASYP